MRRRNTPVPTASAADVTLPKANVTQEALKNSVHADLDCSDCHARRGDQKPTVREQIVGESSRCVPCHAEAAAAYAKSIHGVALSKGNKGAASCRHCHGAHDIRKVSDPLSLVYKRRLPFTCARCHQNPEVAAKLGIKNGQAASRYFESIHGRALLVEGLIVAPTCVDCHGASHNIRKADDPKSSVYRKNIPKTCGKCHQGPRDEYAQGIHGQLMAKGDSRAPVCIDCHTAHQITEPDALFIVESDRLCGNCHSDRLKHFRETYHGRASDLGDQHVAACFDCHGSHAILPASNPASTLSAQNRANTCRKCHPGASDRMATFYAHGDHSDRENYPVLYYVYVAMTGLLLGTFGFFGIHTLIWFGRTLREYWRDPEAFREAKRLARAERGSRLYTRFRPIDRFCHFLLIVSFLLLVATGMPLKFHQAAWAHGIFSWLGGAQGAASLHRIGAVMTGLYMLIHLTSMVRLLRRNRAQYRDANGSFSLRRFLSVLFGPDSPLPNLQDVRDLAAHLRWFAGAGPRPQFDRFTYWEKFDYMAVFWGVTVIGISGLMMWFPLTVTRLLPGWSINIAHIIHSDEALLAAGFIFTVHFFNSHFRPEKFPLDTVMFSGHITEAELRHERPKLYARMQSAAQLDELDIRSDWSGWKPIFGPIGMLFLATGIVLALAIFWAMGRLLLG